MDVQISTLKPSAFYLGFEFLDARMEWWWTVVWWCHLFYKKPLGAMDTYCGKMAPSCSVYTHLGCSFSASLLFSLFCSSLRFAKCPFMYQTASLFQGKCNRTRRNKSPIAKTIWYALSFPVLSDPSLSSLQAGAHTVWMNRDLCWCLCSES